MISEIKNEKVKKGVSYKDTSYEIEKKRPFMAILPVGSLEQHGGHLPVSTDTIIAERVAEKIADYFNAYLLPPIPYSISLEHEEKISTIAISPPLLFRIVVEIARSLKSHGFKCLVIVNGHGGNFILRNATRWINYRIKLLTILIDLTGMYFGERFSKDVHAGRIETSLMLYLAPELVKREFIVDAVPSVPRDYLDYKPLTRISSSGVWGEAKKSTPEEGKALFEQLVNTAINEIEKILKYTNTNISY